MLKLNINTVAKRFWRWWRTVRLVLAVLVMISCGLLYGCRDKVSDTAVIYDQSDQAPEHDAALQSTEEITKENRLYVHICGCVQNPGVYEVIEGSRIYMLVELAGGLTDDAAEWLVGMAGTVSDGQTVYIPSVMQAENNEGFAAGEQAVSQPSAKININLASREQLMTLKGIGEAKAEDIIEYRNACGGFKAIEEIMNISGIKEAAYNKIKDDICVR